MKTSDVWVIPPINDELRKWAEETRNGERAKRIAAMTPEERAMYNQTVDVIVEEWLKMDWKEDV